MAAPQLASGMTRRSTFNPDRSRTVERVLPFETTSFDLVVFGETVR